MLKAIVAAIENLRMAGAKKEEEVEEEEEERDPRKVARRRIDQSE